MAYVQIAVRFRRKTGLYMTVHPLCEILIYLLLYEIAFLSLL